MKTFKLTAKFYILFSVILLIPALWITDVFNGTLIYLLKNSFLEYLVNTGVVEVPTTIIVLLICFWIFDKFTIKVKGIQSIVPIPYNINGRYEGDLISSYDDSKKYKINIEIKQSLTDIKVFLYTENSQSYSILSAIGKNINDVWELFYIYENNTNTVNHDEDMKEHAGITFLKIFDKGNVLEGFYFNNPRNRGRHGSINVKKVSNKLLGKFY